MKEKKDMTGREINKEIAKAFNVLLVTCGGCGYILSLRADRKKADITCSLCGYVGGEEVFPDLFY